MPYKLPTLEKWDIIEVLWHDAQSDHGQFKSGELKARNIFRKTLGHFIKLDGAEMIIAGTDDRLSEKDLDSDAADITWVPIGMIRRVTKLTRPRPTKKPPR